MKKKHGYTVRDLTGQTFGKLRVVAFAGTNVLPSHRGAAWTCQCQCGATMTTRAISLLLGHAKSCGCARTKDWKGDKPITPKMRERLGHL